MSYLSAFALISFICLGLFSYSQSVRIDSLKESNQKLKDAIELSEMARKKEQQDAIEANKRRAEYAKELTTKEQELSKLRIDLASGAARVSIRAKCPVSEPKTDTTGSATAVAQLDPIAEQAYLDLRASIIANESKCEFFRREAIAR